MELHIAHAKRLTIQYLAVRRFRRIIALLAILLCCAVVYLHLGIFRHRKSTMPSAIGCKSKIAQVASNMCIYLVWTVAAYYWTFVL